MIALAERNLARGWSATVGELQSTLARLEFSDASGGLVETETAFTEWASGTADRRRGEKTLFLLGNGASSSMASHFAADLAKNGHLHTQVFSDAALLTAIANDLGVLELFAEPLRRSATTGDLVLFISSSGASPNLLRAAEVAREIGCRLVTLTAMQPDNPLRQLGDLNGWVPASSYGLAETCHAAILHHWMDRVESERGVFRGNSGSD